MEFWTEHWGNHGVEELVEIARRSPLTGLIERHLDRTGCLLEACCGLGQYVLLLRSRGFRAVGTDWSFEAVRKGARAGGPLAVMDLRALGARAGSVSTYLSLGVVEHDPEGPDAIVREAARVLRPGGTLLISVPYWNGMRRLFGAYLARSSARTAANGGQFYQYAFSRREVRVFLRARGFTVRSFHPYDPARLLRKARRALARSSSCSASRTPIERESAARAERRGLPARALRALLYTSPGLRLLGHMILAVAVKA
jgi:SAM-dependent methyltransferase